MRRWVFLTFVVPSWPALAQVSGPAKAPLRPALFALILGVNRAADPELPLLRYADDDAARYLDLMRLLQARTYLLSRLDGDTQRLHPQAAAEAREPRMTVLTRTVDELAQDVAQARQRGVPTVVYVIYAGHGNVRNGEGFISLEDGPLTGRMLARDVIGRINADRVHLIVDACYSYFLAYTRGPGGERRNLSPGFSQTVELAQDPKVGLLLSTSSARESHEWEAFQAGIFNHEIRSGLFGAADANGDGEVSYQEIAAFIERANAAIPNARFRPQVHARPPRDSDVLADLRPALGRRVEIDGKSAQHYVLEDVNGVRLAEFHNAPGQAVRLIRPAPPLPAYLRVAGDERENFGLPSAPEVVRLEDLSPEPQRVARRGAEQEAFGKIFSLPFDALFASRYRIPPPVEPPPLEEAWSARRSRWTAVGWGALALGGASLGGGVVTTVLAERAAAGITSHTSQQDVERRNGGIRSLGTVSAVLFAAGTGLGAGGAALLLWPMRPSVVTLSLMPGGGQLGWAGTF